MELPKTITGKLETIYASETDDWVILRVETEEEPYEFHVQTHLARESGAYPGDQVEVTWEDTDITADVVIMERITTAGRITRVQELEKEVEDLKNELSLTIYGNDRIQNPERY